MMSDPKRLMNFSAGDGGVNDEVSAMGRALLGSLDPTPAERDRVLGRVIASAGLMAGATATVALSAKAGAAGASQVATAGLGSGAMSLMTKLGLLLLVAAPITATSVYLLAPGAGGEPASSTAAASTAAASTIVEVDAPEGKTAQPAVALAESSADEADSDAPVTDLPRELGAQAAPGELAPAESNLNAAKSAVSKPLGARPSAPLASSSLVEEDRLLRSARQMAKAGDTQAALAALHMLDQRFPQGVLLQERELLRISVLNQAGRETQAEKRAEEFREQYPDSPYGASGEKK